MANLHLENFAKIKNSDLDIQDITVIAGKPGTGKSYIMKMFYAIYEASDIISKDYKVKKNILELQFEANKEKIYKKFNFPLDSEKILDDKDFRSFILEILKDTALTSKFTENGDLEVEIDRPRFFYDNLKNILKSIFDSFSQISENFLFDSEICKIEYINSELIIEKKKNIEVDESIFVETPLILEFKPYMIQDENKMPYHISSLLKILKKDHSFTDEEQDKFIDEFSLKSQNILRGEIKPSEESFSFISKNGKQYNIINTSSGTKSIGLLQYLVTNKALKKNSILFWEEPEVHLHPTWQLKMVELFIELMKNGVKIVFSTHSPYMCDYLNALTKKQKIEDRVSFNLLNEEDSVVSNIILNDDNWNLLQSELLEPLEEIMWEYV